jgi:hypothetical protein
MTPAQYRANKLEIERQMQHYNNNFVAKEFAYNIREDKYGEICMQNLAGITVYYSPLSDSAIKFRTYWSYNDCVLFDNEKEMLAFKIKNG